MVTLHHPFQEQKYTLFLSILDLGPMVSQDREIVFTVHGLSSPRARPTSIINPFHFAPISMHGVQTECHEYQQAGHVVEQASTPLRCPPSSPHTPSPSPPRPRMRECVY